MEVRESMIESLKASDNRKSTEIEKLKRKLHESNKRVRHLSEEVSQGLQERDHALVRAEANRQVAQHSKDELEEEQLAQIRLQEESTRREVSLVEAQSRIAYLESLAHWSEVVEEYRHSIFGKVEVAIACKMGYDYLEAQLPTEMRSIPDRFNYPSRVANCLVVLLDIERQGGGLDLGENYARDEESNDKADEGHDERIEEGGEGPAKEASGGSAEDS